MENGGIDQATTDTARKRREARKRDAQKNAKTLGQDKESGYDGNVSAGVVVKGVTITWLAAVFNMDIRRVNLLMRECPPLTRGISKQGGYVYDIAIAASYLVTPRVNVSEYVKNMRPEDMPTKFQEGFWSAQIKKQTWMTKAKMLWHTIDVTRKFSETFLKVNNSIEGWEEEIEKRALLPEDVRKALNFETRRLKALIFKEIAEMGKETPPQTSELIDVILDTANDPTNDINEVV